MTSKKNKIGRPKKSKTLVKDYPKIMAYIPNDLYDLINDFLTEKDYSVMSKNQLVILSIISYLKNYGVIYDTSK